MSERSDNFNFHHTKDATRAEYRAYLDQSSSFLTRDQAQASKDVFDELAGSASNFAVEARRQSMARALGNDLRKDFTGLLGNLRVTEVGLGDVTPASTPTGQTAPHPDAPPRGGR